MVYTGKPSTGCFTCRKRRIKCDEGRPTCGQCHKSKRICTGYRDSEDMIFRNETSTTEAKVTRKERDRVALQVIRPATDTYAEVFTPSSRIVPRTLSEDLQKLALSFFMSEYVLVPRHTESCRGFMEYMVPVYKSAKRGSPLFSSISATALFAMSTKLGNRELAQQGRLLYGQACGLLQEAINDPVASRSNETLMSVLLLTLYITMSATRTSIFQWGTHADGAAALVRHRGKEMLNDPLSRRLYWAVTHQTLINQIIKCEPMEPFLDWTDLWTESLTIDPQENAANRLTSMASRLPALRHGALKWLKESMSQETYFKLLKLKQHAVEFDEYIQTWVHSIPKSWKYSLIGFTERQGGDPEDWIYYPGPIHGYYDLWVANIWNSWRGHRIISNYIVLNCCQRLYPPSELEGIAEYRRAKSVIQGMCNDIVASIPFNFGYTSPLSDAAESIVFTTNDDVASKSGYRTRPDSRSHREATETLGGSFLTWHLFVSFGAFSIPEEQRRYISGRLLSIAARYGVGQAAALHSLGTNRGTNSRGITLTDLLPEPYDGIPDLPLATELFMDNMQSEKRTWQEARAGHGFRQWKKHYITSVEENLSPLHPFIPSNWEEINADIPLRHKVL